MFSGIIGSGVIAAGGGAGPPGSPFLHLDPTDSDSIITANQNGFDTITDWQDTNGGITYTQTTSSTTANDRVFVVSSGLNGLDTVRSRQLFGNVNLRIQNSALGQDVDGVTIGMVVRQETADIGGLFYFSRNGSTSAFRSGLAVSPSGTILTGGRRLDADSFQSFTSATFSLATWHYLTARYFYSTAEIELRLDGAVVVTKQTFQTVGNTSNTTSDLSVLANDVIGRVDQLEFGDILVYHEALSDSDNSDLETFFTDKWGL